MVGAQNFTFLPAQSGVSLSVNVHEIHEALWPEYFAPICVPDSALQSSHAPPGVGYIRRDDAISYLGMKKHSR